MTMVSDQSLAGQICRHYSRFAIGVYCIWKVSGTVAEVCANWYYTQMRNYQFVITINVSTVTQCCFNMLCIYSYLHKGKELQALIPHRPSLCQYVLKLM